MNLFLLWLIANILLFIVIITFAFCKLLYLKDFILLNYVLPVDMALNTRYSKKVPVIVLQ